MMHAMTAQFGGIVALGVLAACAPPPSGTAEYRGIQTVLLDDDLVQFNVAMTGGAGRNDVSNYAACAAAQYALIRGFGFARQVRTNVAFQGGVWRGDAVYTISAALPRGSKTIDAEVTVRDCGARGIPTV
jgi:hypothetical protein